MPSFAYSIARCWVIVSRPPLVIIGTAAGTPRIGLRARAAVIVTMLPPVFCANICLMVSWVTYRKPSRLVDFGCVLRKRLGKEDACVIDEYIDRMETGERGLNDFGGG